MVVQVGVQTYWMQEVPILRLALRRPLPTKLWTSPVVTVAVHPEEEQDQVGLGGCRGCGRDVRSVGRLAVARCLALDLTAFLVLDLRATATRGASEECLQWRVQARERHLLWAVRVVVRQHPHRCVRERPKDGHLLLLTTQRNRQRAILILEQCDRLWQTSSHYYAARIMLFWR
jgi:hypothetical protein